MKIPIILIYTERKYHHMTTTTQDVVSALLTARAEKKQLSFLHTDCATTEEACYKVQDEYIRRIEETVKGYKISLTNTGLQETFHTDSPVYGTLSDSTVVEDGTLHRSEFFDPLVETELMFILTEDLSKDADAREILEKSVIAPGLEIPDCRLENWFPKISIPELIMDNAVTGSVVVGEAIKLSSEIKLEDITVKLYLNEEEIMEGHSSFVLDNPVNAVIWLNQKLATQGKRLTKGMIISSGTFINPVPLKVGTYRAVFDHFGEVKLDVKE